MDEVISEEIVTPKLEYVNNWCMWRNMADDLIIPDIIVACKTAGHHNLTLNWFVNKYGSSDVM